MKITALVSALLLVGAFATAQACPYGEKMQTTSTDSSSKEQTVVKEKTPLKGGIVTTAEPTSSAN